MQRFRQDDAKILMVAGAAAGIAAVFRAPLTGIVFALELTHDVNMMLPLLIAVTVAHAFTVLVLQRSILTEKIARRGYHVSREYSIDPLEILFVREVMRTNVAALPANATQDTVRRSLHGPTSRGRQHLYPVVRNDTELVGVVTRRDLQVLADQPGGDAPLGDIVKPAPVVAYPDESLRMIVYRMAETGLTRFPVVERSDGRLVGLVALADLLKARALNLDAEKRRERVLGANIAVAFADRWKRATS
jgi:CBS domain-containing protein